MSSRVRFLSAIQAAGPPGIAPNRSAPQFGDRKGELLTKKNTPDLCWGVSFGRFLLFFVHGSIPSERQVRQRDAESIETACILINFFCLLLRCVCQMKDVC